MCSFAAESSVAASLDVLKSGGRIRQLRACRGLRGIGVINLEFISNLLRKKLPSDRHRSQEVISGQFLEKEQSLPILMQAVRCGIRVRL